MSVPVVRTRHMRVNMGQRVMRMQMAVRPLRHHCMGVVVVPVVVAVRVVVLHGLVQVFVAVRLGQV